MAKIFINYRRVGIAKSVSGRIYDHLVAWFGRKNVFKDVDDIPKGADFGEVILDQLHLSDVLVAVIGPGWVNERYANGRRKLDNPEDWVRIEIETALRLGLTVIPVLLEGATFPTEQELPASLRQFARCNYIVVREDPDFERDMERLINGCEWGVARRRIRPGAPGYEQRQSKLVGRLHLHGQWRTRGQRPEWQRFRRRVAALLASVAVLVVVLVALAAHSGRNLLPLFGTTATPGPTFPLHVLAPGAECDSGWSHTYWSNRFGATNCLSTYTRLTSGDAKCSGPGCAGVGSLEFALGADHLRLPTRYTISVVATFMVEGQKPVAGTTIYYFLQNFVPATPYGVEYGIVLYADGSYEVVKGNCAASISSGCSIESAYGSGSLDVTTSHTLGYAYDGKNTYALLDGKKFDLKSSQPPAAFKYVQMAVVSPNQTTPVSANFSDFRIQPN